MEHYTFNSKENFLEVPHFVNADGEHLFCRYYETEKEVRGILQVVHAYGGHCGVYENVAQIANDLGMVMIAHDHSGNGESEGEREHSFDYKKYLRDVLQHTYIIREKYPNTPVFLFGHSMGGALAVFTVHEKPDLFKGMILSAPGISASPESVRPYHVFMVRLISSILPFVTVGRLNLTFLSRNEAACKAYDDDPLIVERVVSAGIAQSYLSMFDDLAKILPNIKTPYLLAHGKDDKICDIGGSKLLHELSISEDKTFKIYPGMRHMLEHEIKEDTDKYLADVKKWLSDRL